MPIVYTNNGNGTVDVSVFFDNVNKVKADAVLNNAARYAYEVMGMGDHGTEEAPKTWDDLTVGQKLQLVFPLVTSYLLNLANVYHINTTTETARKAAVTEVTTLHGLT